jgi:stage II sporulation protein AA (anti-sigma F factor antagonist)
VHRKARGNAPRKKATEKKIRKEEKIMEAVAFAYEDDAVRAMIKCEIDHHTARGIREKIDREMFIRRPSVLYLDFSGVRFMDSSGIGLIIGRSQVAEAVSSTVKLVGLSDTLRKLIRLSGIERIKNIYIGK